jgi:hypothetical protein
VTCKLSKIKTPGHHDLRVARRSKSVAIRKRPLSSAYILVIWMRIDTSTNMSTKFQPAPQNPWPPHYSHDFF